MSLAKIWRDSSAQAHHLRSVVPEYLPVRENRVRAQLRLLEIIMQWFFLSDTQEQVPVQEEHVAGLVQTGVIRSNTLIWHEGMEQWVACSEIKPELFARRHVVPVVGAAATARQTAALHSQSVPAAVHTGAAPVAAAAATQLGDGQAVREASAAIATSAGWMKFLGISLLIFGVAHVLSALFVVVMGGSADGGLLPGLVLGLITASLGGVLMWMGMLLFQSAAKAQEAALTAQKHTLLSALRQSARFFKIWGISAVAAVIAYGIVVALFFSFLATLIGGTSIIGDFHGTPDVEMLGVEDHVEVSEMDGLDSSDSDNTDAADESLDDDAEELDDDLNSN